jgi:hypothetical protein
MIVRFNSLFGHLFDGLLYPFQGLNSWVAIVVLSLVTAIAMLLVYRTVSDQNGIRKTKDRIAAHLLEMLLYQDNMPATFRAQGSILWWNLKYILHSMKPMLIMIVPLVLIIIQLDMRLGQSPIEPGGSAIIKLRLQPSSRPSQAVVRIEPFSGVDVETPPLRIDSEREVSWRVRAKEPGIYAVTVRVNSEMLEKRLVVGWPSLAPISSMRVSARFFDLLMNPGEPPLSGSSGVQSIEIGYPPNRLILFGWRIHWLVAFFILSVLFGFTLKGAFKVQI